MPIARFQMPDGRVARFEVPEGTTPEQAQNIMANAMSPQDTAAEFKGGKAQIPGLAPGLQAPQPPAPAPASRLTQPGSVLGNVADAAEGAVQAAGRGNDLLAKITGAVETALHLGSALTTGSFGMAGGFLESVAKGQPPEKLMQERGDQYTYMPKSEQGQEQAAAWGKALEPGMALMGHPELAAGTAGMQRVQGAKRAALDRPEAHGMANAVNEGIVRPVAQAGREAKAAVGNAGLDAAASMVKVNPQKLRNAGAAIDAGLDVPLHAIGDRGAVVQGAGEALAQVPLSGSKTVSNKKTINRRLIEGINPEEPSLIARDGKGNKVDAQLTPQVVSDATKRSGEGIGANMAAIDVPAADGLGPALDRIRRGLEGETQDTRDVVGHRLGEISRAIDENGGTLPGAQLQKFDSEIGEKIRSMGVDHPLIASQLVDLQAALRDAAEARMTPEKAQETATFRQQYARAMSLIPAFKDIRMDGYIEPGKLMKLVTNDPLAKRLMAMNRGGDWQDLGAAGALVDPAGGPNLRGRLIGGAAGVGAGGVYLGTSSAALTPVGAGAALAGVNLVANAYNRVGPKVVRKLVERERARNAPPPEAPPPELTTEPGAGGPGLNPRGNGTVLPDPNGGPLGPNDLLAGPIIKSREPGINPLDEPSGVSGRLSARGAVFDNAPLEEKPPSRIIKSRAGEVERRALKDVPAVPGRPDMPETMVAGNLADRAGQSSEVAGNLSAGTTGAGKGLRTVGGVTGTRAGEGMAYRPNTNPEAMQSEGAALGRAKIREDRFNAAGGEMQPGNFPERVAPAAEPAVDPRMAEIEKLRAGTDSPVVLAALKKREAEVKKTMAQETAARQRDADVADLEAAIRKTDDPDLKATLRAEADKLREKIPTGEVKEGAPDLKPEKTGKIPVGKAKEVPAPEPITPAPRPKLPEPEVSELPVERVEGGEPIPRGEATEVEPVPVGEAAELLPTGEATEVVPVGEAADLLPTGEAIDGPPPITRAPRPPAAPPGAPPKPAPITPAPKPRMIEAAPKANVKRVRGDNGVETHVTLPDGTVKRIQRLDATTTQGVPGWHDLDAKEYGFLGDTQAEAVSMLEQRAKVAPITPAPKPRMIEAKQPSKSAAKAKERADRLYGDGRFDAAVEARRVAEGDFLAEFGTAGAAEEVLGAIESSITDTWTRRKRSMDPAGYEQAVADKIATAAAERKAWNMRRAAKERETRAQAAADAAAKALRAEIKTGLDELETMHQQGRITYDEVADLTDKIRRAESADDVMDLIDEVAMKKDLGGVHPARDFGRGAAANDLPPEAVAKVAKDHGLGTKDMERAKAVAAALEKDEAAVVAATTKGHTPAAFDAEIERINRTPEMTNASQPIQAAESSTRPEPRGQDAAARTEQPRPDGAATARADGGKAAEAVSKEQRQAAINAETLENRPDAVEVAQPTKGKRVRVETVTLSGPKTVTANLYELPGYKGPQLAVAEYKSSRGQGYKVYLPKSGAFIHDSNGVQPLNEALKQAVLRIDHARQTLGAKAAPAPKPMIQAPAKPAPKPLIARKNSEILADLNKQIDERLPAAEDATDMPKWEEPNKAELRKWVGQIPKRNATLDDAREWLHDKHLQRYDEAAKRVGKVTIKSGGTTYTVVNTRERLQALKDEINKSPAFKDRPQARPAAPRGTEAPVTGTRAPKTVVADMVAEGDFENATVLAEHYGVDIKAGMDAKQKKAYQDWLDSRDLH